MWRRCRRIQPERGEGGRGTLPPGLQRGESLPKFWRYRPSSLTPASSDEFRSALLRGLYEGAQRGDGTDLEVIILARGGGNDDDDDDDVDAIASRSFRLHHAVAAASSRYFAAFPEPRAGRVFDDVDAASFAACVEFLYTGECVEPPLSRDNVASILRASGLLQIDRLTEECREYLRRNLHPSNWEQVVDLSDRFGLGLGASALRFKCENSARDELISNREELARKLGAVRYEESQASHRRQKLESQLESLEERLNEILQDQHDRMLISRWESNVSKTNVADVNGTFQKTGSVGHFAHANLEDDPMNIGSSIYVEGEDAEEGWDFSPPRPTKEQFEKYGIIKSHDCLDTAVKASKPWDRIYLEEGLHINATINIYHSLELIGLGKASNVIIDIGRHRSFVSVIGGSLGMYNITFQENGGDYCLWETQEESNGPMSYARGSGDEAIVSFRSYSEDAEFIVKNCVFDMGIECESARPTRVSGIFLKQGKSAVIEGCNFLGGAGSAIAAISDPDFNVPSIEIARCKFVSNGQPSFLEKSANQAFRSNKSECAPIPGHEVTPGPSSVELWRLNRPYSAVGWEGGLLVKNSIKMTGNEFSLNLRAPLGCREVFFPMSGSRKTNDCWLCEDLYSEDFKIFVGNYLEMLLTDNQFRNNGLQFEEETIRRMKSPPRKKEGKRQRTEGTDWPEKSSFPDGPSLLMTGHWISQYDKSSFPKCFEGYQPEPLPEYSREDYFEDDNSEYDNESFEDLF